MRQVLKHMESPFGFIQGFQMEARAKSKAEERNKEAEDRKDQGMTNWELTPDMQKKLAVVE